MKNAQHGMKNILSHPNDEKPTESTWTSECKCGKWIGFGKSKNELDKKFKAHVKEVK
jgi:hypothetical protein